MWLHDHIQQMSQEYENYSDELGCKILLCFLQRRQGQNLCLLAIINFLFCRLRYNKPLHLRRISQQSLLQLESSSSISHLQSPTQRNYSVSINQALNCSVYKISLQGDHFMIIVKEENRGAIPLKMEKCFDAKYPHQYPRYFQDPLVYYY